MNFFLLRSDSICFDIQQGNLTITASAKLVTPQTLLANHSLPNVLSSTNQTNLLQMPPNNTFPSIGQQQQQNNSQLNTSNLTSNLSMSQQQLLQPNMNMSALPSTAPMGTKIEPTNTLQPPVSHMKNPQQSQTLQLNNNIKIQSLEQQLNTNVLGSMLGMGSLNAGNNGTNGGNMLPSLDKSRNMPMMPPMNMMNDKSIMGLLPDFDDPVEQSLASLEQPIDDVKSTDELMASAQRVQMGLHNGTQWPAMNRQHVKMDLETTANHLDMMMDMSSIINKSVHSQALMHQLGYDNMHHSDGGNNGFGSMDSSMIVNGIGGLPGSTSGMMMGNMPPMSQPNSMSTGVDHMSIFQRATEQMARKSSQNVRRHAENGVGIPTSSVGIPTRRDPPIRTDSRQMHRMETDSHRFEPDASMDVIGDQHRFEADASSRSSDSQDSNQRRQLAAALSMNASNSGAGGGNGLTPNAGGFRPKPIEELMKPPPSSAAAVNEMKANMPHGYSSKSMDHQLKNTLVASSWSSLAAAGSPQNTPTSSKPKQSTDSFQQFRNKAKEKADRAKLLEQQVLNRSHKEAAEKRQQEQQKKRDEVDSAT